LVAITVPIAPDPPVIAPVVPPIAPFITRLAYEN